MHTALGPVEVVRQTGASAGCPQKCSQKGPPCGGEASQRGPARRDGRRGHLPGRGTVGTEAKSQEGRTRPGHGERRAGQVPRAAETRPREELRS